MLVLTIYIIDASSDYIHHQLYRRDAAHNPLSLAEKKTLIVQINKLPPDRMEQVLLIINSVLPAKDQEKVLQSASNDIEIPLEILDTFTLRKLQQFVEVRENRTEKELLLPWHDMMLYTSPSSLSSSSSSSCLFSCCDYRSILRGGTPCSDNQAAVVVVAPGPV
jgi:hypothetical protein